MFCVAKLDPVCIVEVIKVMQDIENYVAMVHE
jgi:hypothetical protein